jgi:hypothetical protein
MDSAEIARFAVSMFGGGLAGGSVNVLYQWRTRKTDLRTKFYAKVNDAFSQYLSRVRRGSENHYLVTVTGQYPDGPDVGFYQFREAFLVELPLFHELKEARALRRVFVQNAIEGVHVEGATIKQDLNPEGAALANCLANLQKKLKLEVRVLTPEFGPQHPTKPRSKRSRLSL